MEKIGRVPTARLIGWCALGGCCLWAVLGTLVYQDPVPDTAEFHLDESSGRLQGIGSLSSYYLDEFGKLQSDVVVLRQGFVVDAVLVVAFAALGALLLSRDPRNKAGILCLTVVVIPLEDVLRAIAGRNTSWVDWPIQALTLIPAPQLTFSSLLIMFLFDGRLPHRIWRPVAAVVMAFIALITLVEAFAPTMPGRRAHPITLSFMAGWREALFLPDRAGSDGWGRVYGAASMILIVASLLSVLHRWLLTKESDRARVGWVLVGALLFCFGESLVGLIWNGFSNDAIAAPGMSESAHRTLTIVSTLALPVACGIAIFRDRMYRLPMAQKLLELVLLATLLTAGYLAINVNVDAEAFPAGNVLRLNFVTEPVRMTTTAVLLALSTPWLTRWLRGGINRLLFGRTKSNRDLVISLSRILSTASGPGAVMEALAAAVMQALPDVGVTVVLTSSSRELGRFSFNSSVAPPDGSSDVIIQLTFQGISLGQMEVTTHGHPLHPADRDLLTDLSTAASGAVAAAHRALELQATREQLVLTREHERRRISRDLHDGVGPLLSGLGFTLDALRATMPSSQESSRIAAQARQQVREASQYVRLVARGLRPPGVDQLGLRGAITELAARHDGAKLRVTLTAENIGKLSAATEVAAYAIVGEAITNVARHAEATQCRITVGYAHHQLTLGIEDDGVGLNGTVPGLGRTSMIERAEELGGTCRITSHGRSGTTVRAVLPIGDQQ